MDKAKQLAFFYLKFRDRTVKEMRDYLLKKQKRFQYANEDIEAVITFLKENNYLNDLRYVENFVRIKVEVKPQGEKKLKFSLKRRGVSDDLLNTFFLNEEIDEETAAKEALSKKWQKFSQLEHQKQFEKAARFLAARGFSYGIIKKTIAELQSSEVQ